MPLGSARPEAGCAEGKLPGNTPDSFYFQTRKAYDFSLIYVTEIPFYIDNLEVIIRPRL